MYSDALEMIINLTSYRQFTVITIQKAFEGLTQNQGLDKAAQQTSMFQLQQ